MITQAFAQAASGSSLGQGNMLSFLPIILMIGVFYIFLIAPQNKKAKAHAAMVNAVRRGDHIITSGGIVAKVTKVIEGQDEIEVEIAEGVKIKIIRSCIVEVKNQAAASA